MEGAGTRRTQQPGTSLGNLALCRLRSLCFRLHFMRQPPHSSCAMDATLKLRPAKAFSDIPCTHTPVGSNLAVRA